jgi:hypothetical protein
MLFGPRRIILKNLDYFLQKCYHKNNRKYFIKEVLL